MGATVGGSRVRKRRDNVAPFASLATVMVATLLILPSVLRPPPDQTNSTAEFSPDAPPDEQQESIIAALNRGRSSTAGAGAGEGQTADETPNGIPPVINAEDEEPPPPARPEKRVATSGTCKGSPPRQTLSLYAAPCAPAFVGDNGGPGPRGVTATEVNVGVYLIDILSEDVPEGPVDSTRPDGSQNDIQKQLNVFQTYFNENFEFYNRRLRLFVVKTSLQNEQEGRSAAIRAATQYNLFAAGSTNLINHGLLDESSRQKIVTFGGYSSDDYFAKYDPYAYSFLASTYDSVDLSTEMICKQLAGKPPAFNRRQDTSFDYTKERKFGAMLYVDNVRSTEADRFTGALKKCGVEPSPAVRYNLSENIATGVAGNAALQWKNAGATTVLLFTDYLAAQYVVGEAQRYNYFPEWVSVGLGGSDLASYMRGANQNQWNNAIGVSHLEIPRDCRYSDDVRAYYSVDPDGNYFCEAGLAFTQLQQIANGIQQAGPRLSATTFKEGLLKIPRRAPEPEWAIAGGYSFPGDYSYSDYGSFQWWDKDAMHIDGRMGAYRYVLGGKRFTKGEVPTEPLPFQQEGVTTPVEPRSKDQIEAEQEESSG